MATKKIHEMMQSLKDAMQKIDIQLVERWVKDLVIVKTFIGLRFQDAILKKVANAKNCDYRTATADEEAGGIDGYIEGDPVSIKPDTYKSKASLGEEISARFIYYSKLKDGIQIEFG